MACVIMFHYYLIRSVLSHSDVTFQPLLMWELSLGFELSIYLIPKLNVLVRQRQKDKQINKQKNPKIHYQDQTLPTSTDSLLPDQGLFFQSNPFSSPLQPIPWQLHNCFVHLVLWSLPNNFPGDTISNGLMKCELETLPL